MKLFFKPASFVFLTMLLGQFCCRAETVSIVIASNAAPRVQFGAEEIAAALKAVKLDVAITPSSPQYIQSITKGFASEKAGARKI